MRSEAGEFRTGTPTGFVELGAVGCGIAEAEDLRGDVDRESGARARGIPGLLEGVPHVPVDEGRLPGSPDEPTAEEHEEEHHAIVPLKVASGHVDLVQEPVDVEEGAGELVENEDGRVEVHERSLESSGPYS